MNSKFSRRRFLQTSAVVSAGVWTGVGPTVRAASPSDKLNIAVIGVNKQGGANLSAIGGTSQNIVALCDVDDAASAKAYGKYSDTPKFHDYREMFDKMHKQIDAVVISTPDHSHFHPSHIAMSLKKHIYLEKPMAHSVWEARKLTELAAKQKVATQLGVQRHTLGSIHRAVELVRAGAIGKITEVHSWIASNRGMFPGPTITDTPSTIKWDLWLGPAADKPYSEDYGPYKWRFWWDFGTGEAGNWGCHVLDIPFWALNLKYPTKVGVENPDPDPVKTPKAMHTWFDFPAEASRPAVKLHWYQGTPEILKKLDIKEKNINTVFIGEKGLITSGFNETKLHPEDKFKDYKDPKPTIVKSPGFHKEWVEACKGGVPATCEFSYSGPMAETVLLGNVAYRAKGGFDWDSKNLKVTGNSNAEQYLKSYFKKGWEVEGV